MPVPGFRMGWQGGYSHKPDWLKVGPIVGEFMHKHEDVTFVVAGNAPQRELLDFLPKDRVEVHDWVDTKVHPYRMMTLGLDVGLAPLVNNRFNACKSELKWVEYGAMQVPTIASNCPPYSDVIEHGKDGILCGEKDWLPAMEALYEDAGLRKSIGWQARSRVEAEYDIAKRSKELYDFFIESMETKSSRRQRGPKSCLSLGGKMRIAQ